MNLKTFSDQLFQNLYGVMYFDEEEKKVNVKKIEDSEKQNEKIVILDDNSQFKVTVDEI